ncbi:MAG: hypothetical protein LBJ11_01300 [Oscillospiraceae bacterium]|nr:hypothetical protein [Oscillospiraceae bacterium]
MEKRLFRAVLCLLLVLTMLFGNGIFLTCAENAEPQYLEYHDQINFENL